MRWLTNTGGGGDGAACGVSVMTGFATPACEALAASSKRLLVPEIM